MLDAAGLLSLERGDGWVKPWRIPWDQQDLFSPGDPALAGRAEMPSGVRLRFVTDAEQLDFETEPMAEAGNADLYADDVLVSTADVEAGGTALHFGELPTGEKNVELWLPLGVPFSLREI